MRGGRGFSLIEMVLALTITLTVSAGVFTMVGAARSAAVREPELGDRQQRLRVASEAITAELLQAGAGPSSVSILSLARSIPTVLPSRPGPVDPDAPSAFRADALTVVSAVAGSGQATLAGPLTPASTAVPIDAVAGCPMAAGLRDPACGFKPGVAAVVFDATGAYDHFTVSGIAGNIIALEPGGRGRSHSYPAGSVMVAVSRSTYYLKPATGQLMRYNGLGSDAPAIDEVAALRFEFSGSAPMAGGGLVPIAATELTDGPWRPDAGDPNRYDADLLRIRRITVHLRLRAATAVNQPDLEASFDVAPRNLIGDP